MHDMARLPDFLGFSSRGDDFLDRYKGVLENVEKQAKELATYGGLENEERFQIAVKRYHDALERELLWDDRMPRSRFVSGADQPRIPGITRRILTANVRTTQRGFWDQPRPSMFKAKAQQLGLKPAQLFRALKPERDARNKRLREQPFGTPL